MALSYTAFLVVVSFIKLDRVPKIEVDFADKVFHVLAYALLFFLWYAICILHFKTDKFKIAIYTSICSVLFGVVIDILQSVLTTYRSLDLYDILANTIGVFVAVAVTLLNSKTEVKKI